MEREEQGDAMEARLREWATWLACGTSAGFPVTNVLHQSWLPPAPGQLPTMQTGGRSTRRERAMHAAVLSLSRRLQNTLFVVYVQRVGAQEQAVRLECAASTVRARVIEAKRLLSLMPGVLPVSDSR
jgi:DNA-directed RNA polymerase specialized sigma24 family protein